MALIGSGTFALRHLGARPLIEDRSVVARAFTLASMRVGYRFNRDIETFVDVFNLFVSAPATTGLSGRDDSR